MAEKTNPSFLSLWRKICFSSILIVGLSWPIHSQSLHIGLPIEEYYAFDFEQIHAVTHDTENKLYISTGMDIICFKGFFDRIIHENDVVSSLNFKDSLLYVGGMNYFGKLKSTNKSPAVEPIFTKTESYVTHISNSNYGNFILSKNTVFHFTGEQVKKYSFPGIVDFLGSVNESTILHDDTNGLSIFVGGRFKIVNNSRFLADYQVKNIQSFGPGEYLIATKDHGIFRFDGENFSPFGEDFLENRQIVDIEIINSEYTPGEVVIITNQNELISLNFSGDMVQDKLFTSELLALHQDDNHRLHIISKKGIHTLFYNLPFQFIDKSVDPIHGPISIFNNKFYWGTNNGLFYSTIKEQHNLVDARIRVKDTEGKVGKLDIINNTLLMSHEDGLYDILPKIGARFIPDEKFFDFVELTDEYLLGFSDRKAYLLQKIKDKWRVKKEITDFPIHPKSAVYDKNNFLWLIDRDYNLLQYQFEADKEYFNSIDSKGNANKIEIFELNKKLVLFRENNIFRYNYEQSDFEVSDELSAVFGKNLNIEEIINDQYGNVWYIQDGKVGVFRSVKINGKTSFKKLVVDYPFSDARSIYPYDKNNVFINNGSHFVKIDLEKYQKTETSSLSLSKAIIKQNNQEKNIYNQNFIQEAITLKPTEKLRLLFDKELTPDSYIEYAIATEGNTISWIDSKNPASLDLETMSPGNYNLYIRNKDYHGFSEQTIIPLNVSRGFLSGRTRFVFLTIIGLLTITISFLLGYIVGKKRA